MRLVSVAVLALAVAACVGDRTELGGVDSRMDIPAQSQACKASDLKLIVPGKFEFPGDALIFYYAQQKNMSLKSMKLRYDVNEAGMPVKELCRKHGFSDASFYKWRAKFGGMDVSEARRLKELESENGKLKRLLAEAHLDIHALKTVLGTK